MKELLCQFALLLLMKILAFLLSCYCFFMTSDEKKTVEFLHNNHINVNQNLSPLACPFAHSLALLTHLLAPHCLLRSLARSAALIRLLTHLLPSSWGSSFYLCDERVDYIQFLSIARRAQNPLESADGNALAIEFCDCELVFQFKLVFFYGATDIMVVRTK